MAVKHECTQWALLSEIQGKIKGNNELTLLKMDRIEEKIDDLTDTVKDIKDFMKWADDRYVTKNQVKFVFTVLSYVVSVWLWWYYLLEWLLIHR